MGRADFLVDILLKVSTTLFFPLTFHSLSELIIIKTSRDNNNNEMMRKRKKKKKTGEGKFSHGESLLNGENTRGSQLEGSIRDSFFVSFLLRLVFRSVCRPAAARPFSRRAPPAPSSGSLQKWSSWWNTRGLVPVAHGRREKSRPPSGGSAPASKVAYMFHGPVAVLFQSAPRHGAVNTKSTLKTCWGCCRCRCCCCCSIGRVSSVTMPGRRILGPDRLEH